MTPKLHWTQTPEGRKKMSEAQLASNARRRAAAGVTMTKAEAREAAPKKRGRPWNYGKKMPPRKMTAATRQAIVDGLKARRERLAEMAANGHTPETPILKTYGKSLVKADMRRYAIMGMKIERAELLQRLETLNMAIGKE